MKDLVTVKSKTINNESIPIIVNIVEVGRVGEKEEREISRTYNFVDFQTEMPLEHAQALVEQNPKEFKIIGTGKEASEEVKKAVKKYKKKKEGFTCPKCGKTGIKSKAGVTSHIRYNHPELFAEMYPPKEKK